MLKTNEKNAELSVYRTLCCDAEIVITDGAAFPDCPNHPNLTTQWKALPVEIAAYVPKPGKFKLLRFEPKKDFANARIDEPGASKSKLLRFEKKKPQMSGRGPS